MLLAKYSFTAPGIVLPSRRNGVPAPLFWAAERLACALGFAISRKMRNFAVRTAKTTKQTALL